MRGLCMVEKDGGIPGLDSDLCPQLRWSSTQLDWDAIESASTASVVERLPCALNIDFEDLDICHAMEA
jgi:hypothetical protein